MRTITIYYVTVTASNRPYYHLQLLFTVPPTKQWVLDAIASRIEDAENVVVFGHNEGAAQENIRALSECRDVVVTAPDTTFGDMAVTHVIRVAGTQVGIIYITSAPVYSPR